MAWVSWERFFILFSSHYIKVLYIFLMTCVYKNIEYFSSKLKILSRWKPKKIYVKISLLKRRYFKLFQIVFFFSQKFCFKYFSSITLIILILPIWNILLDAGTISDITNDKFKKVLFDIKSQYYLGGKSKISSQQGQHSTDCLE